MEKKKNKINLIDIIIVLVIVVLIGIVGMKFLSGNGEKDEMAKWKVSFFCEDVPTDTAELIEKGDAVSDDDKKVELGVVETVEPGPSRNYVPTADGELKLTSKEDAKSVEVVALVTAKEFEHGFTVGAARYGVGHSLVLRVGKTMVTGRVSGIEKIAE